MTSLAGSGTIVSGTERFGLAVFPGLGEAHDLPVAVKGGVVVAEEGHAQNPHWTKLSLHVHLLGNATILHAECCIALLVHDLDSSSSQGFAKLP